MSQSAVIYWSGTGNTKAMAESIVQGMQEAGATVDLLEVSAAPADLSAYDKLAFGCPSMGAETLEDASFDPYFTSVEGQLSGKKVALFGSYGWGDGEWMRNWVARANAAGAQLLDEGLICQDAPDAETCAAQGKKFAGM